MDWHKIMLDLILREVGNDKKTKVSQGGAPNVQHETEKVDDLRFFQ